ncbi:ferredoxin [Actinomycetospora sp. C-140]
MRITADHARCEGHGLCADTAPDVYDLDDDAVVVVRHEVVPSGLERAAEAGARLCPVAALRIEREDPRQR